MKLVFALLACVAAAHAVHAAGLNAFSQCAVLGFDPATLDCGTCTTVGEAVGRAAEQECLDCCNFALPFQDKAQYAKATLRVFRATLGGHGGVNEFVEKSAARYSGLKVADAQVHEPTLQFTNSSGSGGGSKPLSVAVGSWKMEHIEALLARKLAGAAADAVANPRS